jgi:hypothetical protein
MDIQFIFGRYNYKVNNINKNNIFNIIILTIMTITIGIAFLSTIIYMIEAIKYYTHEKFKDIDYSLYSYILLLLTDVFSIKNNNNNYEIITDEMKEIITEHMDEIIERKYSCNISIIIYVYQSVIGTFLTNKFINESTGTLLKVLLITTTTMYYIYTLCELTHYPNIFYRKKETKIYRKKEIIQT